MADEQKGTAYKVLVPMIDGNTDDLTSVKDAPPNPVLEGAWREVPGTFTAANDIAAIKMADSAQGPFDFGAVAVPARSWRPRTPKDEMVPRRLWT